MGSSNGSKKGEKGEKKGKGKIIMTIILKVTALSTAPLYHQNYVLNTKKLKH